MRISMQFHNPNTISSYCDSFFIFPMTFKMASKVQVVPQENVDKFFNNLDQGIHQYDESDIRNMDETGFSTVPSNMGKIISLKVFTSKLFTIHKFIKFSEYSIIFLF